MSTMPPLPHSVAGQVFDIENSEVVKWLISQPQLKQWIFDKAVGSERIKYNGESGLWCGVPRGKRGRPSKAKAVPEVED